MLITPQTIAEQAIRKCGSISEAARKAEVDRSTLKRIRQGKTKRPHRDTLAQLVRIANG